MLPCAKHGRAVHASDQPPDMLLHAGGAHLEGNRLGRGTSRSSNRGTSGWRKTSASACSRDSASSVVRASVSKDVFGNESGMIRSVTRKWMKKP